ncbi:hypothetical protein QEH52_01650 [Coraliomargarita sp. SDUM461003]|uniref:Roadblock/LAMTOR2 domain-containing protein n=1 Tax=Thalassobacterium maritimum TaxID=3041265 RepID=A0ABU1AQ06_9BACT|nr:hypothetical protein [Coraliomargarita sp. SDUM461003]MDQ8206196.1 hypothetical protein [Coraliomargarita sp. SDUM461003]
MDLESMGGREVRIDESVDEFFCVHRLFLGGDCVVMIADRRTNRLLCVCANELSPAVRRWIERSEFDERFTQCSTMQLMLGAGYVFCSFAFAAEWSRRVRVLLVLQARIGGLLGEAVSDAV